MSYLIDATNEKLSATFAGTYGDPVTLGLWVKFSNHPYSAGTTGTIYVFGTSNSSNTDSCQILTALTDNAWGARYTDPTPGSDTKTVTRNVDNTWVGLVAKITSETSRTIICQIWGAQNTSTVSMSASGNAWKYLRIGESLSGFDDLGTVLSSISATAYVAEVALWNATLGQTDIESYLAGTSADQIAAANLIGYWPLSSSSTVHTNLGSGSMTTDLTVSGATYSTDHPPITQAGTFITPNTAALSV